MADWFILAARLNGAAGQMAGGRQTCFRLNRGMKRWNWSGGPAGHGSMHHRRVGSIGASADPSRTFRGTHMPGQMGAQNVTTQGLRVIEVDVENNILLIKGAVPGAKNSLVVVNRSKKKVYRSLDEKSATMAKKRNPMKQSKAKAKGKK